MCGQGSLQSGMNTGGNLVCCGADQLGKRSGRKLAVTPNGAEWTPPPRVDSAMVKALARAFQWRKMLDTTMSWNDRGSAKAKGIGRTYVSQVLRLTLLAPGRCNH